MQALPDGRDGNDENAETPKGREQRGGRRLEGCPCPPAPERDVPTAPRDFKDRCGHGRQGAQEPYQDGEGSPSAWIRRTALPASCNRIMMMI